MKSYERRFRIEFSLAPYATQWAQEVVDGIEHDTLKVFRPDDELALEEVLDEDGVGLLDARTSLSVSIREWLPVRSLKIRRHRSPGWR